MIFLYNTSAKHVKFLYVLIAPCLEKKYSSLLNKHKGHDFEHLKNVFTREVEQLQTALGIINTRLSSMRSEIVSIEELSKELVQLKNEKVKILQVAHDKLLSKLEEELEDKLIKLSDDKSKLKDKYCGTKAIVDQVNEKIIVMSEVQVVKGMPEVLSHLLEITNKEHKKFVKDPDIMKFSVDDNLDFHESTFVIQPFSALRADGSVIYSPPLTVNGLSWRLKIYPNGNEYYRNLCLSIFLELHRSQLPSWSASYTYRITLLHASSPENAITRSYTSPFESSVSWGYNRFFKLEDLEKDGFYDKKNDRIFVKFAVKNSHRSDQMRELREWNKVLEIINNNLKNGDHSADNHGTRDEEDPAAGGVEEELVEDGEEEEDEDGGNLYSSLELPNQEH